VEHFFHAVGDMVDDKPRELDEKPREVDDKPRELNDKPVTVGRTSSCRPSLEPTPARRSSGARKRHARPAQADRRRPRVELVVGFEKGSGESLGSRADALPAFFHQLDERPLDTPMPYGIFVPLGHRWSRYVPRDARGARSAKLWEGSMKSDIVVVGLLAVVAVAAVTTQASAAMVPTPRGLMDERCVHVVPNGAHVNGQTGYVTVDGVVVGSISNGGSVSCALDAPPSVNGNEEGVVAFAADYDGHYDFTTLVTDYVVPSQPEDKNTSMLALWSGLNQV
jgi:hypothetical protein